MFSSLHKTKFIYEEKNMKSLDDDDLNTNGSNSQENVSHVQNAPKDSIEEYSENNITNTVWPMSWFYLKQTKPVKNKQKRRGIVSLYV